MALLCGGTALALYLLSLGLSGFDRPTFYRHLMTVSPWRLGLLGIPFAVTMWAKWRRWYLCIHHVDPTVRAQTVWHAQLWGYCASNLLPFKAGEVVKLAVLKKKGHAVLPLFPTIALDRFWDGAVLLLLLLVALPFFSEAAWMREMAVAAAVLFVGGLVVFCGGIFLASTGGGGGGAPEKKVSFSALLRKIKNSSKGFARWIPQWAWDRGKPVILGLSALRSWRLWVAIALFSIVNWLAEAGCFAVVFWAFGVSVPLAACMVAVAAVNFAGLVIAVPASIGVFEFCVVAVVGAVGVSSQMAFGTALVLHALMVLLVFVVAGAVFLLNRCGALRHSAVAK